MNATGTVSTFSQTTLHAHSPLISGTFTLDIGGQSIRTYDTSSKTYSISNIPYNVGASVLQAALRQIVGFEDVEVFRVGEPEYGAKWVISYVGYDADVPDLVLANGKLAGGIGTPRITFYETRKFVSDLYFNPVNE